MCTYRLPSARSSQARSDLAEGEPPTRLEDLAVTETQETPPVQTTEPPVVVPGDDNVIVDAPDVTVNVVIPPTVVPEVEPEPEPAPVVVVQAPDNSDLLEQLRAENAALKSTVELLQNPPAPEVVPDPEPEPVVAEDPEPKSQREHWYFRQRRFGRNK